MLDEVENQCGKVEAGTQVILRLVRVIRCFREDRVRIEIALIGLIQ